MLAILTFFILNSKMDRTYEARFFLNKKKYEVHGALADLTSVITMDNDHFQFLHASLPDFLMDPLRSGEYCVSTPKWPTYLSLMWYLHGYKYFCESVA